MKQGGESTDQDYEHMLMTSFGLTDPCDWAAELSTRLLAATHQLVDARAHHADPSKDIDDTTEADALAAIRDGVAQYVSEIHVMLDSMPMMQMQPEILEALQFIVAGVADINRGSPPDWLAVRPTKKHPKRLEHEAEWVPIIAALELLWLLGEKPNVDAAAKKIHDRTGRRVGTIKDWHDRLFREPQPERAMAQATIQEEVDRARAMLWSGLADARLAVLRRIDELLR
jgi:hypothetical protein